MIKNENIEFINKELFMFSYSTNLNNPKPDDKFWKAASVFSRYNKFINLGKS